jgi:hypothetical protein
MKIKKLAKNIKGISTPIGGISFEIPESDKEIIRKLLFFLEDRRVLFQSVCREYSIHVDESVLKIREQLTETLTKINEDSFFYEDLKKLRNACRKYLEIQSSNKIIKNFTKYVELDEFRKTFYLILKKWIGKYKFKVEKQLLEIFHKNYEE